MVLPRFVQSAIRNEEIQVYGDGNQTRVFCHVSDAISAVERLAETESTIGEVYNVGGIGEKILAVQSSKTEIVLTTNSELVLIFGVTKANHLK